MLYSTALFAVCASSGTRGGGEKIPASNTKAGATERLKTSDAQMEERVEWLQNFLVNRPYAPEQFCRNYKSNTEATMNVCGDEYCRYDDFTQKAEDETKDETKDEKAIREAREKAKNETKDEKARREAREKAKAEGGGCTKKYSCDGDGEGNLTSDQNVYCDAVNKTKNSQDIKELPRIFESYVKDERNRIKKHQDWSIKIKSEKLGDANFWELFEEEEQIEAKVGSDEGLKKLKEQQTKTPIDIENFEEKIKENMKKNKEASLKEGSGQASKMSKKEVKRILESFSRYEGDIKTFSDAEKFVESYEGKQRDLDDDKNKKKAFQYVRRKVKKVQGEDKERQIQNKLYGLSVDKRVWTDELRHFCRSLYLQEADEKKFDFKFVDNGKNEITGLELETGKTFCRDPNNDPEQKRCESYYMDETRCKAGQKQCKFDAEKGCETSKDSSLKGLDGVGLMLGDTQDKLDKYMKQLEDEAKADANKHEYKTIGDYGRCTDALNTRQVNNIEECKVAARKLKLLFGETKSKWGPWGPGCRVVELEKGGSKIVHFDSRHESMLDNENPIRRANKLICAMQEIVAKGEACNLKNYCHNQKKEPKDCEDAPEFLSRGDRQNGQNDLIFICDSNGHAIIVDTKKTNCSKAKLEDKLFWSNVADVTLDVAPTIDVADKSTNCGKGEACKVKCAPGHLGATGGEKITCNPQNGKILVTDITCEEPSTLKQSTVREHIHF